MITRNPSRQPVRTEHEKKVDKHTDVIPVDNGEPDADSSLVPETGGGVAAEADQQRQGEAGEEQLEDEEEEEVALRRSPCPGAPSTPDREAHEASRHWPYRAWCEDCVRGRAVGPNAKRVPHEKRLSDVPRAHMDYAY